MDDRLSQTRGAVAYPIGALELLTRVSMKTDRVTSVISSLIEYRANEAERTGGKQWDIKYIRSQFTQKDLEGLYIKYDDRLRETLVYIYISLLVIFSTIHIVMVIIGTASEEVQSQSTYLSFAMYILRILVPIVFLWKCFYNTLKKKWFWMPVFLTIVITVDLVLTDIAVPIFSHFEGIALRPAYSTIALLSIYIFLPMRNNFLAIILGVIVSTVYILIFSFFTYHEDPQIGVVIASDILYHIGVNLMGIYFRLMNEIVTRRSFLDRRACVESTLRLKFVKGQEERLMLSILPEHIVSKVRDDIRDLFLGLESRISYNLRSFNQMYIEEHDNVSILYADVVNYTNISTTLAPKKMVELLNELFGRFDEASEEHDVLRIKFLGDCYYCASGIPKPTPMHAKNCVDLGLEMISIIKDVREKRSLNIDMRIGVHSGRILSGLIGIKKWQFDIWSKDVTIANKMESTGQAGKVHITKQTFELIMEFAREYIIEPNYASRNDPFILKNKLETYLISRPLRNFEYRRPSFRRPSVGINKIVTRRQLDMRSSSSASRRTTTFMNMNIVDYQLMMKAADAQMAKEIEDMTNGKDQFRKESNLNRFTLMYNKMDIEKAYLLLPDPLFKYYITCCLIITILILLINGLTTKWFLNFSWYSWSMFVLLLFAMILLQPLTWFHFIWTKYVGVDEPRNPVLRKLYDISASIIKSATIRTAIYLIISLGLAATSVVNVISCSMVEVEPSSSGNVLSNCVSSWHVTQCWGLALLLNFLFSRVFFIFKWIVAGGMTVFYLWVVWEIKSSIFAVDATWNVGLDPRVSHTLSVIVITVSLYLIDRTTEYRNRLDNLWQIQEDEEQRRAETMLKVNNMLLENILPAHVVQVYLDLYRPVDEFYNENYDNVAVMFASLTDYKLGSDNDADMSDKFVLSILDEVISDFDRLLLTGSSIHKVEKIKVAGWTYMAACGLDPSRRDSIDSVSNMSTFGGQNSAYNKAIVLTMVEFAAAMMMQLQNFNKGSFQSFEGLNLRIGISNGKVAAGVVGALKPLYDIWGHAVNMASRMDSTGETGKIQVTENTAFILEECGVLTTCRGETFVKGAGYTKTYFVPLDEHFNLIRKENSKDYYRKADKRRYYSSFDEASDISFDNRSDSFNQTTEVADINTRSRIDSLNESKSYEPTDNDSILSLESVNAVNAHVYKQTNIANENQSFEPIDGVSLSSTEPDEIDTPC